MTTHAKRLSDHTQWVNDFNALAADFNPAPMSEGCDLYEHWDTNGRTGSPYLILITSDPTGIDLKPGDFILRRTWGAAGTPEIVNHAWPEEKS